MKVVGRTGLEPARRHGTPRGVAGQHYDPELPSSHAAIQPVATGCLNNPACNRDANSICYIIVAKSF